MLVARQAFQRWGRMSVPTLVTRSNHLLYFGSKTSNVIKPIGDLAGKRTFMNEAEQLQLEIDNMTFISAAADGDVSKMKSIMSKAQVDHNRGDYFGRTALHLAAAEGQMEAVEFLVTQGADVNAEDRNNRTPLESALYGQKDDVIAYLVGCGAVLSKARESSIIKSILVASAEGSLDTLRRCAAAGCDMSATDYDQRSGLHLAAAEGHLACVQFLLDNGADPLAEDRFGNIPIMDAMRTRKNEVVELLRAYRSEVVMTSSFQKALASSSVLQQALPIICQRGGFDYAEAWIPVNSATEFSQHDYWFCRPEFLPQVEKFANFKAGNMLSNSSQNILGRAWNERQAVTSHSLQPSDVVGRFEVRGELRSCVAVPVFHDGEIHALLQLYTVGKQMSHSDAGSLTQLGTFTSRLLSAGVFPGDPVDFDKTDMWTPEGQIEEVYQKVLGMGVFSAVQVYNEVEWFYKMGLQQYFFQFNTSDALAKHLHSYIASKQLASTLGSPEDIWMNITDSSGTVLLVPNEPRKIAAAERNLEKVISQEPDHVSLSLECFHSERPHMPGGTKTMAMYILKKGEFATDFDSISEDTTEITHIASKDFLATRSKSALARYQAILSEASGALSPVTKIFPPLNDGDIPTMVAFKSQGQKLSIQHITQLVKQNNVNVSRKFLVTFGNGMTVVSLYFEPHSKLTDIENLCQQFSMLQVIPFSSLTPSFLDGSFTSDIYAYASAVSRFVYYFINQRTEEYETLLHELADDKINLGRLKLMYTKLKVEAVSESRITDVVMEHKDVVAMLANDFKNRTTKLWEDGNFPDNQELKENILAAANALDQQVLLAMLEFNKSVLKTNLYKADKSALAFRLAPNYLQKLGDYPKVPYGVFFLVGADFQGFHIRFADVARGGIRLIQSADNARYNQNLQTLFGENYGLAYTQNNKNKDIPEFGSKGTILLHPHSQANGFLAFRKYISGLLDLLVSHPQVVDNYGQEEVLFLGPDEGTANMMEWASKYAGTRDYKYWRAFTTGKPNSMGGVPHDKYGMTTRSVHRYVLGSLRKLGLREEDVTKIQTGGPDGDLGSNEILISKDRTKVIIDGAGVLYDPEGLDRGELTRLATKRLMSNHFDGAKLGPGGFKVLTTDRDVTLPTGEVVENGTHFRNTFHFHDLAQADMFVPCGGRPESVNLSNVKKLLDKEGKCRFKIIVEGANLFFTNDARMVVESAGAVLFKDASSNKGGVTSSSLEVFAALALNADQFKEHMAVEDPNNMPEFYKRYVQEIQEKIEYLADLEFECIWREYARTKGTIPRYMLTEQVSEKINELAVFVSESDSVWNNEDIRKEVLLAACPRTLVDLIGYDQMIANVPESYMRAIFSSSLASKYVYEYGVTASEFTFFEFMQKFYKRGS